MVSHFAEFAWIEFLSYIHFFFRLDDRLISEKFENWSFGKDFTGDFMVRDNIDSFAKDCQAMGEIQLAVTSAVQGRNTNLDNYQENSFDIQFAGLVTALKVLSKGGNLIMVSYTLLSSVKVSLIYFLNTVFEEVHMYKPATGPLSKFEIFIICLNFKKDTKVDCYLEQMKERVGPDLWEKGEHYIYIYIYLCY